MLLFIFFLMIRLPPRSTRTDTLFPSTTLFRSRLLVLDEHRDLGGPGNPRRLAPAEVLEFEGGGAEIEIRRESHAPTVIAGHIQVDPQDRKSTRLNSSH